LALVRSAPGAHASLSLFAYVMVRHALRRLGEGDRALADYLAAIVIHFGVRDRSARVGESDDQVYAVLADLYHDVNDPDARRSLLVRAHLGNYALWLSGIFPDHVEQRRWNRGGPHLGYYEEMGRRSFERVPDIDSRRGPAFHGGRQSPATISDPLDYLLRISLAKAENKLRSHGSGVLVSSSGCHCTASIHQLRSTDSAPSMMPSDARAVTQRSVDTRATA